jgi:RHS repeat-associated protein
MPTAVPITNSYNESLTYDKNGNIKTLQRNGDFDSQTVPIAIDNLTYTYKPDSPNQLASVTDAVSTSDSRLGFSDGNIVGYDFAYDVNGNMIQDLNKKVKIGTVSYAITKIVYNHLNLPTEIFFANTKKINYIYNALGEKLQKTVTQGTTNIDITDYVGGFQYLKSPTANLTVPTLQFFPTSEGFVNYDTGVFKYVYNYLDHLGSVRLSYTKSNTTGLATILDENHYCPFGLKHTNYNQTVAKLRGQNVVVSASLLPKNKRLFNGKELQDELKLNMYDFGNRNYDATIGRFFNIDRFSEKYLDNTPYHYTKNNPVFFVDIKGDSLAVFKPDGSFWKIEDDGKEEWSGRIYQKSKTKYDKKTKTTYQIYSNALDFEFADPENDSKAIKDGTVTQIVIVDEKQIANIIGQAGALDPNNKNSRWSYISAEGRGGGRFDFSVTSIPANFPGANASSFGRFSPFLFLPKGESLVHNHFNFGNFLYGAGGNALGFGTATLMAGAHYNSIANSGTNGYPGQSDSDDDQKSIYSGSNYSIEHQFSNRTWSSVNGISPVPTKR